MQNGKWQDAIGGNHECAKHPKHRHARESGNDEESGNDGKCEKTNLQFYSSNAQWVDISGFNATIAQD